MSKYICKYNVEVKKGSDMWKLKIFWEREFEFESKAESIEIVQEDTTKYIKEKMVAELLAIMISWDITDNKVHAEKRDMVLDIAAWGLENLMEKFDADFILDIKTLEECE